jgi:hypothetical protein
MKKQIFEDELQAVFLETYPEMAVLQSYFGSDVIDYLMREFGDCQIMIPSHKTFKRLCNSYFKQPALSEKYQVNTYHDAIKHMRNKGFNIKSPSELVVPLVTRRPIHSCLIDSLNEILIEDGNNDRGKYPNRNKKKK